MIGASVICFFTATLTYAFFKLVTKRFHLRLSKVEEVLGLDCQEDETRMTMVIKSHLNDLTRENSARLNLLNMVRSGNHVSKKKRKNMQQDHMHIES